MNKKIHRKDGSHAVAFSLIELLVVMSIMIMMLSLAVPAGVSLMESSNIARAGQIVVDQIRVARQLAAARNLTVEVRLIKTGSGSDPGYNAVQLWTTQFTTNAISKLATLPQSIAISENPTISGLLGVSTNRYTMPSTGPNANAPYAAFQVTPSGLVTPTSNANSLFFVTVLSSRYAKVSTSTLPPNYVIVQINPNTGSPLAFQP